MYSIGLNGIENNLHRFNAAALEINRSDGDNLPDAEIDMIIAKRAVLAKLEIVKTAAGLFRLWIDIFA